jgi:hypothetical protein
MRTFGIFITFLLLGMTACSQVNFNTIVPVILPTSAPPLPHSMKGYELWSWPVDDEWHFTLITGTNRLKTVEEITNGEDVIDPEGWVKINVMGVDGIKRVLARLPRGEQVFWVGGWYLFYDVLTLPPQVIVDAVRTHSLELGLELSVVE